MKNCGSINHYGNDNSITATSNHDYKYTSHLLLDIRPIFYQRTNLIRKGIISYQRCIKLM